MHADKFSIDIIYKINRTDVEVIGNKYDNPKLMERPIVVSHGQARIGRPPEQVLDIVN